MIFEGGNVINIVQFYYGLIQKIFRFREWHVTPYQKRPYAVALVKKLNLLIARNQISEGQCIEVGCGLGDIIANVKWPNRVGLDLEKRAVWAAHVLHPCTCVKYGSFDCIFGKKISVIIAVNFLHGFSQEQVHRWFYELTKHNDVSMIVVDKVESPPYAHSHDYKSIFRELGYLEYYSSRGFDAWENTRRHILFFKKGKNEEQEG